MATRTLRYLLGAALLPLGAVGLGAAVLAGPWSPLVLDRANARYVAGDLAGAAALYEAAAEGWHTPATRADAAERAAMIHVQQGEHTRAANDLRRAAELSPSASRRGAIRSQLAALYLDSLRDPVRAAETWEQAEVERADGEGALAAARAWERAGREDRAMEGYEAARLRGRAHLQAEAAAGVARLATTLAEARDGGAVERRARGGPESARAAGGAR